MTNASACYFDESICGATGKDHKASVIRVTKNLILVGTMQRSALADTGIDGDV